MAHHLQKLPTSHVRSGHFERKSLKNITICEFPDLFSANRLNFSHKRLSGKPKANLNSQPAMHIKTCATAWKPKRTQKTKACLYSSIQ
ncbi:hypothetical protein CES85_0686 [Ochrobactrum quorumnocens]|uniref:Uncharacterized protein n=1 Tax=Ochrobactrum quorumnocens TaxID=271865 RepID=A0A248UJ40_9HYPH|nr:hypothetical protein CES85_0686 [[Ochrobactrum] quorumnocens]